MEQRPRLWGKLIALVEGEVPSETLVAYQHAGQAVYELLAQAEDRRLDLKIRGLDPWDAEPATQAELLCTWNAFTLQILGDQFLDADDRANPATAGYVPPVTAEQVLAFYRRVEGWLSRAHQAHSNPAYRLDVAVPADMPHWSAVQRFADAAFAVFQQAAPPPRQPAVQRLQQMLADATTKAEYAEGLLSGHVSTQLHEQIEQYAKGAIERYYRCGQLLAMPRLLDAAPIGPRRAEPSSGRADRMLATSGQPGFDPWCLTDPESRARWQRDPKARQAVAELWRCDPNPERTSAIQAEIEEALARGDLAYAMDRLGRRIGHYYCCPWSSIYVVRRPVTIDGVPLRTMQEFTFDVSTEGVLEGGRFKRNILRGAFHPTTRVDYCDLRADGHDE